MKLDALVQEFHQEMLEIYWRVGKLSPPYRPTRFLRMVSQHGGKETADRLLATDEPSEGFSQLYRRGHENLRLTVEYLVLQRPWCQLFTKDQLEVARQRLLDVDCPLPQ